MGSDIYCAANYYDNKKQEMILFEDYYILVGKKEEKIINSKNIKDKNV